MDVYREQPIEPGRVGDGLKEKSTAELIGQLFREGQALMREEVRLAKAELREEARRATRGGAMVGVGAVLGLTALSCFAAFLILVGVTFFAAWVSALIVFALFAIVAIAIAAYGKKKLGEVDAKRPVEHLKEDGRWMKQAMRGIRSSRRVPA